jgi:hypothetical protein
MAADEAVEVDFVEGGAFEGVVGEGLAVEATRLSVGWCSGEDAMLGSVQVWDVDCYFCFSG